MESKKNVMFFVSTEGHVKGARTLASVLKDELDLNVSISDLSGRLSTLWGGDDDALLAAGLREEGGRKSSCLRGLIKLLRKCSLIFSFSLFYCLFLYNLLFFASFNFWRGTQDKPVLHSAVMKAFFLMKRASSFLQRSRIFSRMTYGVSFSRDLFFGIFEDNRILDDLAKVFCVKSPDLLVLQEFNLGYKYHLICHVAREFNIPILVMPYTMAGAQEWVASFKDRKDCRVSGVFRSLLAKAYPDWVSDDGMGGKIILPVSWLVSCVCNEFDLPLPWVTNSVPGLVYAVDNEFTRDFYSREGVDTSDWFVLGSLEEDMLHAIGEAGGGLIRANPFVLIALPPDQFEALDSMRLEFSDYKQLVSFMIGCARSAVGAEMPVVVVLHPRTNRAAVAYLEDFGIVVSDLPLESLVSSAFLYIAVSSATIRWAIASGIPVINFDAYHYGYHDYSNCCGVVEVRRKLEFESALSRMIHDKAFYDASVRAQRADAQRYFKVDGLSKKRVVALVSSIIGLRS
ncbi:hypothetical protein [Aquipseudomonas alcaligenes]|uniref:hypothetical protein n=1 Tax=Aquipseudomonas alcaligenes TaxID=43263 RepID=UPI0035B1BD27